MNNNYEDEIRKTAIIALVSDDYLLERLVLKGGNAINYIFNISARSSIDIDYSINGEFTKLEFGLISEKLEKTLKEAFIRKGYEIIDFKFEEVPEKISENLKTFWGGYKISFKIIDQNSFDKYKDNKDKLRRRALVVGPKQRKTFKIDISKFEYCSNKQRGKIEDYNLYVYSPEMIVFEKARAICQQTEEYKQIVNTMTIKPRARDFYDIHLLMNNFSIGIDNNREIMQKIFESKKVPLSLLRIIYKYRDFHAQDFPSVLATTNAEERSGDFNYYFDFFLENFCN
ncbi:MAG: nucleotidyl transferase AbiEii/AbiGii toxin family protein [Candidatus Krumholzibacteriales bacterium]